MTNYGSNIIFGEERNDWIASANLEKNDTIIINKHKLWKKGNKYAFNKMIEVIPHETIHNILWCKGLDDNCRYDHMRNSIIHSTKLSSRMRKFYYCNC